MPGENASPSPYYFELRLDPVVWADIGDRDLEQAVVHSHVSSAPRPSRTDVERIGLWRDRPYVIYSVRLDELAAWRIGDGQIESVPASRDGATRPDAGRTAHGRLGVQETLNEPFMKLVCGSHTNL